MINPRSAILVCVALSACAEASHPVAISTAAEPAGTNCPNGGVRVDVGDDANGNGYVDPDEVTSTQYVCNGSGAQGDLVQLADESAGTNCSAGGTRIEVGPDTNGNGSLDAEEVASTSYVCNGGDGSNGGGGGQILEAYTAAVLDMNDDSRATAQTATLTAPTAGTIFAIANVDAYCGTSGSPSCASGAPAADVCISISTSASADACASGPARTLAHLGADETVAITRTSVTAVAAGSHTFYLRASTEDFASTGEVGLYRRQLTLIYIAD